MFPVCIVISSFPRSHPQRILNLPAQLRKRLFPYVPMVLLYSHSAIATRKSVMLFMHFPAFYFRCYAGTPGNSLAVFSYTNYRYCQIGVNLCDPYSN